MRGEKGNRNEGCDVMRVSWGCLRYIGTENQKAILGLVRWNGG